MFTYETYYNSMYRDVNLDFRFPPNIIILVYDSIILLHSVFDNSYSMVLVLLYFKI